MTGSLIDPFVGISALLALGPGGIAGKIEFLRVNSASASATSGGCKVHPMFSSVLFQGYPPVTRQRVLLPRWPISALHGIDPDIISRCPLQPQTVVTSIYRKEGWNTEV